MLGDIDQRHSKVARRIEDREAQRADQDDVAGGRGTALPKCDCPSQDPNCQRDRHRCMGQAKLFKISEAASPRRQFSFDRGIEALVLETQPAKGPHQRHVVDDINHLSVDGRGLVCKIVVQRLSGGSEPKHCQYHSTGDDDQGRRHRQAHRSDEADSGDSRDTRRQNIPDEHVFDGENCVRCRRDAAGQHSRQTVGKVTGCMTCQVAKDISA